ERLEIRLLEVDLGVAVAALLDRQAHRAVVLVVDVRADRELRLVERQSLGPEPAFGVEKKPRQVIGLWILRIARKVTVEDQAHGRVERIAADLLRERARARRNE